MFNPFPGLRPFEPEEDHLFFGREKQIDELLRRLRVTRFLQLVGSSGSGKSSLVRCGLIPALYSGFMVKAGSSWRVLIFRPGEDPIGHLAAALDSPDVLGTQGELASTNKILLEATLRRSTSGLVDAVRQAHIPAHDNLLVVVDQFEELFRFRRSNQKVNSRDEAVAFFRLLLEAAKQEALPIYVVLTMRSDFIGDCMEFPGLPEAVNAGLYLVPRMTRDEVRSAISGPVAVGGGEIAQRLVLRLLNDIGDNHDQLPVLQHALMRTWDHWAASRKDGAAIDIDDYEAVGTLSDALSRHAEEAYLDNSFEGGQRIAEKMFKALTDTFSDPRGIRRPTSVAELAAICEVPEADVIQEIEVFRRPGRSFLTPPANVPLDSNSIIDISHESLMRCWTRLIGWAEEERESARTYTRISQAASWCSECTGGLWSDPQLETGLQWRRTNHPTHAWAERYDSNFIPAMKFLDDSQKAREVEREKARKRKRILQQLSAGLAVAFLIALTAFYVARRETKRAERNLALAKNAVDQSLSSAGAQQGREEPGSPDLEQFRKQLLDKAKVFYLSFDQRERRREEFTGEAASGHNRLGDINRLLEQHEDAVREYELAIAQFESLVHEHPGNSGYRQKLAYAHHWLGETLRTWMEGGQKPAQYSAADAKNEYGQALKIQEALHAEEPNRHDYQQELARSYYNRGILYYDSKSYGQTEADFRRAITLLEPIAASSGQSMSELPDQPKPAQDLARVYGDLGNLLRATRRSQEAIEPDQKAIDIQAALVRDDPSNREYKQDLVQFYNNLALALADEHKLAEAQQANHQALDLVEELVEPSTSLSDTRAKVHELHNWIFRQQMRNGGPSPNEIQDAHRHPEFHVMYMGLGRSYAQIAEEDLKAEDTREAEKAIESMLALMPQLTSSERTELANTYDRLKRELNDKRAKQQ